MKTIATIIMYCCVVYFYLESMKYESETKGPLIALCSVAMIVYIIADIWETRKEHNLTAAIRASQGMPIYFDQIYETMTIVVRSHFKEGDQRHVTANVKLGYKSFIFPNNVLVNIEHLNLNHRLTSIHVSVLPDDKGKIVRVATATVEEVIPRGKE